NRLSAAREKSESTPQGFPGTCPEAGTFGARRHGRDREENEDDAAHFNARAHAGPGMRQRSHRRLPEQPRRRGKRTMKTYLASTCLAAGLLAALGTAAHAECGDVTIASMNWQSAEVLASLDQFILNNGYGCNASIISGDTVPTITSMVERGDPDLAPEGWVDLVPEVVGRGLEEGRIVGAAVAISDGA